MPGASTLSGPSPPRRSRARRGQGERLRTEILEAAEGLLVETGDESALSIRAVAEAVGVTPPSIYLHFADRNALLFAVSDRQFDQLDRAMDAAAAGIDDPSARLVARGRAYVDFALGNPEHYRIIMMGGHEGMQERFVGWGAATTPGLGSVLNDVKAAIAAGQLAYDDALLVACGLWANVHGLVSLLIAKPDFPWPPTDELVDHVIEVYGAGLAARRLGPGPG